MKTLFLFLLMSMSCVSYAQETTVSPRVSADLTYPHKKHCTTTRVGEWVMISGGSLVAVSGLTYLGYSATNPSRDLRNNAGLISLAFGAIGLNVALDGAVVFLIGKIYEHRHMERFSVISKPNGIGLAYHF